MTHRSSLQIMGRRPAVRYNLQLPVVFRWSDGTEHAGAGFTTDVSLDGVHVVSYGCPPVGAEVHLEVLVPPLYPLSDELLIECCGKVNEISPESGRISFRVLGKFDDAHLTRLCRHDSSPV